MAILTDEDIRKIINERDLVIYPFEKDSVTGLGYDLHIGCIYPLSHIEHFSRANGKITIPPNCYCVVITKEFIWLSGKLIGTLHARGTLAAKGLYTNATNVDPNFKGQMIMSVVNLSNANIILKENQTFITLILHEVISHTKTLVGSEGTKRSMRVTEEMIGEIYQDKSIHGKELETVNHLHHFLHKSNEEHSTSFDALIEYAKKYNFWRMMKWQFSVYRKPIRGGLFNTLTVLLSLFLVFAMTSFLYNYYQTSPVGSGKDWEVTVVAIAAILTVINSLREIRKK